MPRTPIAGIQDQAGARILGFSGYRGSYYFLFVPHLSSTNALPVQPIVYGHSSTDFTIYLLLFALFFLEAMGFFIFSYASSDNAGLTS